MNKHRRSFPEPTNHIQSHDANPIAVDFGGELERPR